MSFIKILKRIKNVYEEGSKILEKILHHKTHPLSYIHKLIQTILFSFVHNLLFMMICELYVSWKFVTVNKIDN